MAIQFVFKFSIIQSQPPRMCDELGILTSRSPSRKRKQQRTADEPDNFTRNPFVDVMAIFSGCPFVQLSREGATWETAKTHGYQQDCKSELQEWMQTGVLCSRSLRHVTSVDTGPSMHAEAREDRFHYLQEQQCPVRIELGGRRWHRQSGSNWFPKCRPREVHLECGDVAAAGCRRIHRTSSQGTQAARAGGVQVGS
jgi:hypothetical protein